MSILQHMRRELMVNQEHFKRLTQGVDVWNAWREKHPDIRPDLSRANLSDAYLSNANLRGANLNGANLTRANETIPIVV
jgi:uncharacterized protein YjbI with pentapeptide repeats